MQHQILVFLSVAVLATTVSAQTNVGTAADEAAIKKNAAARLAAVNKHDAKAAAATYAADADRATVNGYFSGRAQIEKSYADTYAANPNQMVKVDSEKIHFLTADVAIRDSEITVRGRADGTTTKNHLTDIYVKRANDWVLVSSRNIRKQPPQP